MCSESEAGLWRRPSAVWELSVPSMQAGPAGGEDPRLSVEFRLSKRGVFVTLGQSWCCFCRLAASDLQCLCF